MPLSDPKLGAHVNARRERLKTALRLADEPAPAKSDTARMCGTVTAADAFVTRHDEILGELNDDCAAESRRRTHDSYGGPMP